MIEIDNLKMYFYEHQYVDIGVMKSDKTIDNIIGIKNERGYYELRLWGLPKDIFDNHGIDCIEFDDDEFWHRIVRDEFDDI